MAMQYVPIESIRPDDWVNTAGGPLEVWKVTRSGPVLDFGDGRGAARTKVRLYRGPGSYVEYARDAYIFKYP